MLSFSRFWRLASPSPVTKDGCKVHCWLAWFWKWLENRQNQHPATVTVLIVGSDMRANVRQQHWWKKCQQTINEPYFLVPVGGAWCLFIFWWWLSAYFGPSCLLCLFFFIFLVQPSLWPSQSMPYASTNSQATNPPSQSVLSDCWQATASQNHSTTEYQHLLGL